MDLAAACYRKRDTDPGGKDQFGESSGESSGRTEYRYDFWRLVREYRARTGAALHKAIQHVQAERPDLELRHGVEVTQAVDRAVAQRSGWSQSDERALANDVEARARRTGVSFADALQAIATEDPAKFERRRLALSQPINCRIAEGGAMGWDGVTERRRTRPTIVVNDLQDHVYDRIERAALIDRLVAFANWTPEKAATEIDRVHERAAALFKFRPGDTYRAIDAAIERAIERDDARVLALLRMGQR